MAISVKNIGPKKLTSLLDWFSKKAGEIYQSGNLGAKNILNNALSKEAYSLAPYGVAENLPNPNGVLTKAYRNVGNAFSRTMYPGLKYIDENIDENTLQNLIFSYSKAAKAAETQALNTPIGKLIPHNNTALGKWFRNKLPQDFNTLNFNVDIQDLP